MLTKEERDILHFAWIELIFDMGIFGVLPGTPAFNVFE